VREGPNPALQEAKSILEMGGNSPRLFQNTLAFLAIDQVRLQDLDEAVRRYLAWDSIVDDAENEKLDLSAHQLKQAKEQKNTSDTVVSSRLPDGSGAKPAT
jgi:hypothetical protein